MTIERFAHLAARITDAAAGRQIVYIPNPGNYGDGLIRYATKAFLADYRITHIELNIGFRFGKACLAPFLLDRKKFFFLYGGGGAWCKAYDFGRSIVRFIARFTDAYLVLPSTFEEVFAGKGIFFARDLGRSRENMPGADFCHDMAFYLSCKTIPYHAADRSVAGNLFRTDHESARAPGDLPADNIDLSRLGTHMSNGDAFLEHASRYGTINTDRLHVSIAGALCGAEVRLSAGNYFKIEEIYRSSMIEFFPDNVTLTRKTA